MKIEITYTEVPHGGHMFAMPEPIKTEIVEVDSWKELDKYIASQKDAYKQRYKKEKKPFPLGHRFSTNNGGVIAKIYKEPLIKKI